MTKILRIDYSIYELESKFHPNSRTNYVKRAGCLLRFLFKDIGFGYADCHPLEEFGDAPLKNHIALLEKKEFTNLTQRSSHFAKLDATFRKNLSSAFELENEVNLETLDIKKLSVPKNHFTAPAFLKKEDVLSRKKEGFDKFKFKFGRHIPNEINYLHDNAKFFAENEIKIRIDYNGNLDSIQTLNELIAYKDIIDFVEDPFFEINEQNYHSLKKISKHLNFAMDFIQFDPTINISNSNDIFIYKIVKPARENYFKLKYKPAKKMIFTSSMDHPLGQMCAMYEASLSKTQEQCGLITHYAFETNPYSEQLVVKNAQLLPLNDIGFGFDSLLQAEKWKRAF